jgi:putative ubiquitin-RnfH superfamily antitoxin RatB of RatAB toxin-antitoxin module
MADENPLRIEVVYALPDRQIAVSVRVPCGATVADAVDRADLAALLPGVDIDNAPVGIFGRVVSRSAVLRDGDRVEIYRPLVADPKQSRRLRAARRR